MSKTKRLCVIAMLLAISIVLNLLESLLPVFVPGVRLGLANIVILIMLYEFKPIEAFAVDLLRILLVGLLRNFLSPTFFMSLSGGVLSFFVMYLFSRLKIFSPVAVSVLGAVSHATGQVIVAIIILSSQAVVYYLPFIAILSIATGALSGILTNAYLKRSITANLLN